MAKETGIISLIIGRSGSTLVDKNIRKVHGFPLLQWSAAAAHRSKYISSYFISSDCPKIIEAAEQIGYTPILRPAYLATATAQSCDAVKHALSNVRSHLNPSIVVVQHANVGTITHHIIDSCIDILLADSEASAVVPSHQNSEYHPLRAKALTTKYLSPFVPANTSISANRQDLPPCFFFDHSIWVLRAESIDSPSGQPPWPCMGSKIIPYETHGCLDVHTVNDLKKTEDWISHHNVPSPADFIY